jgi:hypothetical protein
VAQAEVVNPGFEGGLTGWTSYNYTSGSGGYAAPPGNPFGMKPAEGSVIWADVRSYDGASTGDHKGVYQTIDTVPGQAYTLTVAVQAYNRNDTFSYDWGKPSVPNGPTWANEVKVGVDTTGGVDPKGASVSYSSPNDTGARFRDISVNFTATGPSATVFLDAHPKWPVAGNWSGFDNVRLTGPGGVAPTLVAYYPLDGDTQDYSGNKYHGAAQGGAAFDADVPTAIGGGQSMRFDGSTGHVNCDTPHDPLDLDTLNFGLGDWTVSGWIKTSETASGDRGTLFSNGGDGGGGIRYTLTHNEGNNGRLRLVTDDDDDKIQVESTSQTNDGQWHHIVGIRQGSAVALYVDGQLQNADDLPGGYDLSRVSQQPAQIGAARQQSDGSLIKQLNGLADDVAIWSVALPHAVVQGLADGTYSPLNAPSVAPLSNAIPLGWFPSGQSLLVDVGPSGQRVEPGGVGLPGAPGNNTGGTNYPGTVIANFIGSDISLALDNVDQNGNSVGGIDWRDRGTSNNAGVALVRVGEDHVKNNGGIVRATLGGLPGGQYLITGYFVDAENSQCENIQIFVTDATGDDILQAAIGSAWFPGGNPGGSGEHELLLNTLDAHSASWVVVSDGVNPIEIVFNGRQASDFEVPLSGLKIDELMFPEPATLTLLALGGLALLRRRRER